MRQVARPPVMQTRENARAVKFHSSKRQFRVYGIRRHRICGEIGEQDFVLSSRVLPHEPVNHTPVEPNPPAPRTVSLTSVASTKVACMTGAITSWAMRSPRWIVKGSLPRLTRMTFTSPR